MLKSIVWLMLKKVSRNTFHLRFSSFTFRFENVCVILSGFRGDLMSFVETVPSGSDAVGP